MTLALLGVPTPVWAVATALAFGALIGAAKGV